MAGFLYFIKGEQRPPSPERIRAWGLGYAFTRNPEHRQVISAGPGGSAGSVIADPDRQAEKKIGYFPDEQTWRKLPRVEGRPELWVGYWNDAKPTPTDLVRANALPSEVGIRLGDGGRWNILTLTEFDPETQTGDCMLPAPLDYDEDGRIFAAKPVGDYARLWDTVHPVALGLCFGIGEKPAPTDDEVREAAIALLKFSYVVDTPELIVLGALEKGKRCHTIVLASCQGKRLLDAIDLIAKKNVQLPVNGSATADGEAA